MHYNLKPFRVWGDAATTIRTSSSATWSKLQASKFVEAVPLEESDLPLPLPKDLFLSCDKRISQLVELTNKVSEDAPNGVFLIGSEVPANDPAHSQEDCAGKGKVLELVFSAQDPDQLQRLEEQILREPEVQSVSVLSKAKDCLLHDGSASFSNGIGNVDIAGMGCVHISDEEPRASSV